MSAASMIRRFREGKPTSRLEREAARDLDRKAGNKEMWWVDRDNSGTDEFEEPRLPPKAAVKPPRVSHNEILERLRQPTDNMSITAAKKFSSDRSLNVDQLIEMEIRGLEREMKIDTRRSMEKKNDRGNYSGDRGSRSVSADRKTRTDFEHFDPRSSYPYNVHELQQSYRYDGLGGGGGISKGQDPRDVILLSGGGDEKRTNIKKTEDASNIKNFDNSLETLLKSLNDNDKCVMENLRKKNNGNTPSSVNNGFENLNSISRITVKLQSDMMEFEAQYRARHGEEEEMIKKQNERDIIMKAEGRNELLKKQFNQIKYSQGYHNNLKNQNENIENDSRNYQLKYELNFTQEKNSDENSKFDISKKVRKFSHENAVKNEFQGIDMMREKENDRTVDIDDREQEKVKEKEKERKEVVKREMEKNEKEEEDMSVNDRSSEKEENESSGELIIINEFENTRGIKEIEKGHANLLKGFHSGLGARIRELDLIHSAVLSDNPSNQTCPKSGIYGLESSPTRNQSSEVHRESGIDHPDPGIKVPSSSVSPPVLESGSSSGPSPGPIAPRVSFGQIGFERLSRPSSNQRIRENSYLNERQEVLIYPDTQGGQGRAFDENSRRSNNTNNNNNDNSSYNNNYNNNNGYNDDNDNDNDNIHTNNNHFISIFDNEYSNRYYDFENNRNNRNPTFANNYSNINDNNNINSNNNSNFNNDSNDNNFNNYRNSNNNLRNNNNNSPYGNYQNNSNFKNTGKQFENNRNKQNYSNYNNGTNGNKKTCVLGTDVQFHPYAQHPYVPSLGPDIIHSNILTVSKGITAVLESAMSSLRINLPDRSLKPPQYTQHTPHTQSTLNSSREQEEKVPYNNLKIEVEVGEAIKSENKKINNENNSTLNRKQNEIKIHVDYKEEKENKVNKDDNIIKSLKENKMKLDSIDNLLGFDAEKDKNDYFAGQLRGFTGNNDNSYHDNINTNVMDKNNNNNNNNNNINNNININDNKNNDNNNENNTILTISRTQNISNNIIPSNLPSINPNYTENRKFLPGVYNPPAYGNRNNGNGKHENGPKIVFAGQTPSSFKLSNNSNNNNNLNDKNNSCYDHINNYNNNNNLNSKNRNFNNIVTFSDNKNENKNANTNIAENENSVSAPPFEIQNQIQGTSLNSEREFKNLKSDLILQQQYEIKRKLQSQKFNEIQYEIGSSTNIRSFPSFSPPDYPPEGTAIRALREKQKEERLKENLNNSTITKKKNLEIASNYASTYVHNKENILPDITSPVNDRLEYLSNMKKMREKMILLSN